MNIKTLFALAFALAGVATLAQAADPVQGARPQMSTQITAKPVNFAPPQRIVRRPLLSVPLSKTITNRALPKSTIAELVNRGQKPFKAIPGLIRQPVKPSKQALLIVLENGGVMDNVDPSLKSALNHNIVTATCGDWEFTLAPGQSLGDMVQSIAGQLLGNLTCIDPGNWQRTTFNPLTWLNQQTDYAIEAAVTANNSLVNTQSRYDRVVVMEDADAVPARVLAMIRELAPEYVLDVHVLTHGGNEAFIGYNHTPFTESNFFGVLASERAAGLPLYLRAVYQMNCVSGTLKDNWRALGAISVNGTLQTYNNNMPHQYLHFLQKWLNGTGMGDGSQQSFTDAAFYSRPVYTLVGQGALIDVSRMTAAGTNANANVNSPR
jgi:hypothetical protein